MQLEELCKYLDTKFKNPDKTLHTQLMAAGGTVNSDKSIDDLDCNYMYDADFDEEPYNIELNMEPSKAKLKPIEIEYIQWKDNLSEMKRFCQDDCKIEYLTTSIDDFWHLSVNDCLTHMWVGVAIGYYVVKLPDGFTVVNDIDFKKYFEL